MANQEDVETAGILRIAETFPLPSVHRLPTLQTALASPDTLDMVGKRLPGLKPWVAILTEAPG
jgi:hypothetical protein